MIARSSQSAADLENELPRNPTSGESKVGEDERDERSALGSGADDRAGEDAIDTGY